MKPLRYAIVGAVLLVVAVGGVGLYFSFVANPRVERELLAQPDGERAGRVMLLTLPSGRRLPVNYLREGELVYAAAEGPWDRELGDDEHAVEVWIRGETLAGRGRAVRDDPARTRDVFSRLRPDALEGFGTLIEIRLAGDARSSAAPAR